MAGGGVSADPQTVVRPDDFERAGELPDVTYDAKNHRLRLNGRPIPTATSVSGMLDKPGLSWGAAGETALFAIHHQDEWMELPPEDAYHRLRKHHRGVWDEKAMRGTTVHGLALEWAKGQDIDCPPELNPYLDALEAFYLQREPQWVDVERNVLYLEKDREYGGQFDYIREDNGLVLGDIKTGRRYPIETTLQISGYRFAQFVATYDAKGRLELLEPMHKVARCEVLYLHDDGTFEVLELPADEATFERFIALRDAWSWLREMERWEKKNPEPKRKVEVA
jgi:hypothetical protein